MNKLIKEVFMRNGFTIKEGESDLKPYVYAAAFELTSNLRLQCSGMEMEIDELKSQLAAFTHRAGEVVEALDGGLMSVSMTARVRKLKALVLAQSCEADSRPEERGTEQCDVPPKGWTCSRDKGHDGPCAASQD